MKRIVSLLLLLISASLRAQDGHRIEFRIQALKDTTVYLGFYMGASTFLKDTTRSDKQGHFVFEGKKRLEPGLYFIVLGKTKIFDPGFVVYKQQYFSLESHGPDYVMNMKVKGDEDNQLFFENMAFNAERHKEAEPFIKILNDTTLKADQKTAAREQFAVVDKKVKDRQQEVMSKYPGTLTAKLLLVNRRIQVPDPPKRADGSIDSGFQFRYYRKHFFDNFDLADDAMTRLPTPVYQDKLNEYLDKLFVQTPDSLMVAILDLANRAKVNKATYQYLVWSCVYKYQKPTIMGLDEIYVRLYDIYFATGEMDFWVSATMKKSMKEYADKLRNSLVGKTGGNLVMQDEYFQKKSLYDIRKKYSLVYFFDPDCGHCREESPKLVAFYDKQKIKFNIEVFAVALDTSMQKLRNYIKEMKMSWITVSGPRSYSGSLHNSYYAETTPMIYILDDKKKIIAKGLPVDRVEEFLTNHEKFEQRRASKKSKGTGG